MDLAAQGTSITEISQEEIQRLEQLYIFRKPLEVVRFLQQYPFLVPLLIEAHYHLKEHFPDSQVFLTLVTDPEEFGSDQLVASIASHLDPDKATDTLSLFDKTWWLKALKRAQGKLCITLEFCVDKAKRIKKAFDTLRVSNAFFILFALH